MNTNYIIFDLEATCWEGSSKGRLNEIIEIGAVKLDENLNEVDCFQCFVKPTQNPELSEFCTKLTSITQKDIENAPYFDEAMLQFEDWITKNTDEVKLLSWGKYDKNQITTEANAKGYNGRILQLLNNHHSLKHEFAAFRQIKLCGMSGALWMLGIELKGTHHRGIDDAKNIAEIFKAVYPEWKNHISTL